MQTRTVRIGHSVSRLWTLCKVITKPGFSFCVYFLLWYVCRFSDAHLLFIVLGLVSSMLC